jgi:dihydroflavonol-4-reductase
LRVSIIGICHCGKEEEGKAHIAGLGRIEDYKRNFYLCSPQSCHRFFEESKRLSRNFSRNHGDSSEMRIVVTGATGLLGNNVVRAAIDQGHDVIAISRRASQDAALRGLPVTHVDADISNRDHFRSAIPASMDGMIHCAAHIHIGWTAQEASDRVNVLGTRHVLELASECRVRCVHVSSVNVLPVGNMEGVNDEDSSGDPQVPCTYVLSKKGAEQQALDAINRGSDVVIVYPGFMLGPWDWKPSSGRMILDLSGGAPPMAPPGGCSVCDARDVAHATLKALTDAPKGGRYILAGENWTYFRLWSEIASRFQSRKPWIAMRPPGRWLIGTIGDTITKITGHEPIFNSATLRMGAQYHWYSSQRAALALGYHSRPASQSLDETIDWFRENGMLAPR